MRIRLALLVCVALLAPGVAAAQELTPEQAETLRQIQVNAHPAECARLRRQIDHFTTMAQRAKALDSEMWQERTESHLGLLRGMQAARCPNDVPVDTTAEAFKQLLILAAKGAATYFTFGMAGF